MRTGALLAALALASAIGCSDDDANPPAAGGDAGADADAGRGDPIVAPPSTWTYVPVEGARCGRGQPLGLAVNPSPDARRVLIFLEGGGWCWNQANCRADNGDVTTFTFSGVTEASVLDILQREKRGILSRTRADNPFRGYHLVYVPYCTGDMHSGRRPDAPSGIAHVGALNLEAFLGRLVPTYRDAEQIVLAGVSAGAFGALLSYDQVQGAFGSTPVHLLSDSGLPVPSPGLPDALWQTLRSSWGTAFPAACTGCSTLADLATWLAGRSDQRRLAFVGSRADFVIRRLFGRDPDGVGEGAPVPIPVYAAATGELAASLFAAPTVRPFLVTSDTHVFVDKDVLDTQAEGTRLAAWLSAFEAGSAEWSARVDPGDLSAFEPGTSGLVFEDPELDEAYGYPTGGGYDGQLDLKRLVVAPRGDTLELEIATRRVTAASTPQGFDRLAVTIFFDLPGRGGQRALPRLLATAPGDFAWNLSHRLHGALSRMYGDTGAGPESLGDPLPSTPEVVVTPGAPGTLRVRYSAASVGIASWDDVALFVTTWDVDPATDTPLPLTMQGGPGTFSGGAPASPRIMDALAPITIPAPVRFTDPAGDERYTYPTDRPFPGTQDILAATVRHASGALALDLEMAAVSTAWNPQNGFDHVAFTMFLSLPGAAGARALPFLGAEMPDGASWQVSTRTHGFGNDAFGAEGASATSAGQRRTPAPRVVASRPARTVSFSFTRELLGVQDLRGARFYVTTWDFDGISGQYREIAERPATFVYGGGQPTDPKLMDTLLFEIP